MLRSISVAWLASLLVSSPLVAIAVGWLPACQAYDRGEYAALIADSGFSSETGADAAEDATDASVDAGPEDPCAVIPRFVGTQTVDGIDDDFRNVPAVTFVPSKGVAPSVVPVPSGLQGDATMQVAWSPAGLHIFAHVRKRPVLPAPDGEPGFYLYDALELFAAGTHSLTGPYGPDADVGAIHTILRPPSGDAGAAAALFEITGPQYADLSTSQFAARPTLAGYDAELFLDWTLLGESQVPAAGSFVAFDFGLDLLEPSADGGRYWFQSFFGMRALMNAMSCLGAGAAPYCDDRTWCRPALE